MKIHSVGKDSILKHESGYFYATILLVDNNLSVYEIMENESLFHDTTRQRSGVE